MGETREYMDNQRRRVFDEVDELWSTIEEIGERYDIEHHDMVNLEDLVTDLGMEIVKLQDGIDTLENNSCSTQKTLYNTI